MKSKPVSLGPALAPIAPILIGALVVLIVIGGAYLGILWYLRERRNARLLSLGIEDIDELSGRDFERLVNAMFRRKGYRSELTPYVGDWGADVVVSKDGVKTVIQAKRHRKTVGVRAVQEVLGAKGKYKAASMLVITNQDYTKQAVALARANGVELWDRAKLLTELEGLSRDATTVERT